MILVALTAGRGQLDADAAASLARMDTARGALLPVTSAHRDAAQQARLRRLWEAGKWPAFVARPEDSDHVKGIAVDFGRDAFLWLSLHAADHGWRRTDPSEPWHYVHSSKRDLRSGPRAAPPTRRRDRMFVAIDAATKRGALIYSSGAWAWVTAAADAVALAAAGVPTVTVSGETFAALTPPTARLGA